MALVFVLMLTTALMALVCALMLTTALMALVFVLNVNNSAQGTCLCFNVNNTAQGTCLCVDVNNTAQGTCLCVNVNNTARGTCLCVDVNNTARADHLGLRQCFADLTFALLISASEVILGSHSSSVLITSTETISAIRDEEPRTATSTFTQLLSSAPILPSGVA